MPPHAQNAARPVQPPGPRIAVVGAGVSGILAAIKLKATGLNDFTIFDKAARLGGAWPWEIGPTGAAVRLTLAVTADEDAGRACAGWAAPLAGVPMKYPLEIFKEARDACHAQLAAQPAA